MRYILLAVLVFASSSAQAWKMNWDDFGLASSTYIFARNSPEIVMSFTCGYTGERVCELHLHLALSCDAVNGPVSLPIQYGDKTTEAILECVGAGATYQQGSGGSRQIYSASRINKQATYTRGSYAWKVSLPGQGTEPLPVFTDKKLTFIFPGDDRDYKYTFSTRGGEKKMNKVYQGWLQRSKSAESQPDSDDSSVTGTITQ